jgi:hypothetical protein
MFFDDEPQSYHDVALICLNGHVINDSSQSSPQFNKKFCDRCGESTISECPSCRRPIKGDYKSPGIAVFGRMLAPQFCEQCGRPFPWTERRLSAAKEVIGELDDLPKDEQDKLKMTLDDLVREGPKTEPAKMRFQNIVRRLHPDEQEAVKRVVSEAVSESIRKSMFGAD